MKQRRTCSIEGCENAVNARGWCTKHYTRWRSHGDPHETTHTKARHGEPLEFLAAAVARPHEGCIDWPFSTNGEGYGKLLWGDKMQLAHRVVLQLVTGESGEGLDAAHAPLICHNRACINPAHLRWATRKENAADMLLDGTLVTPR